MRRPRTPLLALAASLAAALACACARATAGPTGEILWDSRGVPHVYSDSAAGVAYGFGWARPRAHGDLVLRL